MKISESMHCHLMHKRLAFRTDIIAFCCKADSGLQPAIPRFHPDGFLPRERMENIMKQREIYIEELHGDRELNLAKTCVGCKQLKLGRNPDYKTLDFISISIYPSPCQSKCIYCDVHRNPENNSRNALASPHPQNIAEMLDYLQQNGHLDADCVIGLAPSEITIMPHKNFLLDAVQNYRIQVLTNGFIFDEKIAESIKRNGSRVQISLDAGTSETFNLVKGRDLFDKTISNIKKYQSYGKIILKYIVMPGINDGDNDIEGILSILNDVKGNNDVKDNIEFKLDAETYSPYQLTFNTMKKLALGCQKLNIPVFFVANKHTLNELFDKPISESNFNSRSQYLRDMFREDIGEKIDDYRKKLFELALSDLLRQFSHKARFLVYCNDNKQVVRIANAINDIKGEKVLRTDSLELAASYSDSVDVYLVHNIQNEKRLHRIIKLQTNKCDKVIICVDEYMNSFESAENFVSKKTEAIADNSFQIEKQYKDLNILYENQKRNLIQIEKQYKDLAGSKLGKLQLKVWAQKAKKL